MNRDLYNNLKLVSQAVPAVRTASVLTPTGIDTQGAESCAILVHVGASGDTINGSNFIEFEVQESDDNTNWTAAANSALSTAVTGTNTGTLAKIAASGSLSQVYGVGYIGWARYIRVVERRTGTHTNGTATAISVILGNLDYRPASGNAS